MMKESRQSFLNSESMPHYNRQPSVSGERGLYAVSGEHVGRMFLLGRNQEIVIGRSMNEAAILLSDQSIGRKHCVIFWDDEERTYVINDYSINGVFTEDGRRLQKGTNVYLKIGERIRLGNTTNIFQLE